MADGGGSLKSGGLRGWFTRSEAARGWTLLSPTVLLMIVGLAAPLAIMLAYSFWRQQGMALNTDFTLANYERVLTRFDPVLIRSLWISAVASCTTVLLAYPIAYYVAFHVTKRKFVWLILLTIPFWTSYLLRIFAWRVILPNEIMFTPAAVIIALTHAWRPSRSSRST